MPILERFQELCPLANTMEPHVGLIVLLRAGGPGISTFEGMLGEFINSIGITGTINLIPLVVATNAVMVDAIIRRAMAAVFWSTTMLQISVSYAFLSRLPCRYRMKSFRSFLQLLYGGLEKCKWAGTLWITDFNFGIFCAGDCIGIGCTGLCLRSTDHFQDIESWW